MSKIMKRTISILLAVIMIMAYMPATAFAGNNYDFSDVKLYWRDDYVGAYGYSTIKAEIWYLCQHYYNGNLISSAMCDGDGSGYGCWQSIPASKMKEPGKYKLVLSAFSTYNDLHAYESGNLSIKPLYQTSITKDNSTAKRLQTPSKLMWNSDKKTVSWKAVDNAAAYLVDAKKIYKDGHTEDITFDSFPCVIGDDGVSAKDGRVYVNLSKFIEMYSHAPISYSSNVKDVVFNVIAVPDNSGKYFVSKTSEKCYFSGQNNTDNANNNDTVIDEEPGEVSSDEDVLPLYIKVEGEDGFFTGMGCPVGIGMEGVSFYLDEALSKKITSGITFPSGGGTFKKNTSGSFDWDNTNATPGEYQIVYIENGKKYSANLYVNGEIDSDEDSEDSNESDVEENAEISLTNCTISSVTKNYTYTGKAVKLKIKIVDPAGEELIEGQDYTITYKNNIELGKGTATVKGIGKYQGSIPITMTIKLKTPVVSTLDRNYSKLTVKWGKVTGAAGYQIRYSANSDMSNSTYKNVTGASKLSATISSLKGNKKYYARVRAYYVKNNKKIYSNWSDIKSIYVPGHNAVYTESGWKTMKCLSSEPSLYEEGHGPAVRYWLEVGSKKYGWQIDDSISYDYPVRATSDTFSDGSNLYFFDQEWIYEKQCYEQGFFVIFDVEKSTYQKYYFDKHIELENIIDFYDGKFYITSKQGVYTFDVNSKKIGTVFKINENTISVDRYGEERYYYFYAGDDLHANGHYLEDAYKLFIYDNKKHRLVKTITFDKGNMIKQGETIYYIKSANSNYKICKLKGSTVTTQATCKKTTSNRVILEKITKDYLYYYVVDYNDMKMGVAHGPNKIGKVFVANKQYRYSLKTKTVKYLGKEYL